MPNIVFGKWTLWRSNNLVTWTTFSWENFNSFLWQEFTIKWPATLFRGCASCSKNTNVNTTWWSISTFAEVRITWTESSKWDGQEEFLYVTWQPWPPDWSLSDVLLWCCMKSSLYASSKPETRQQMLEWRIRAAAGWEMKCNTSLEAFTESLQNFDSIENV